MLKTYYQRKTVQITLYVAKPRKGIKLVTNAERRAGHRHQPPRNAGGVYDRKAQLLLYSRQLRATACLGKASSNKPQIQHKVKEVFHITSIHNPQRKVKEVSQISSSHNPKLNVKQASLKISTSRKSQPKAKEDLRITSSHNPKLNVKQANLQISTSRKSQHKAEKDLRITSSQNSHQKVKEVHQINPAFPWKVVPVELKPAQPKLPRPPPSCFGDWKKIFLPAFCVRKVGGVRAEKEKRKKKKKKIIVLFSDKMNAIMMSSRMEKERIGVMAKFLSAFGKRR